MQPFGGRPPWPLACTPLRPTPCHYACACIQGRRHEDRVEARSRLVLAAAVVYPFGRHHEAPVRRTCQTSMSTVLRHPHPQQHQQQGRGWTGLQAAATGYAFRHIRRGGRRRLELVRPQLRQAAPAADRVPAVHRRRRTAPDSAPSNSRCASDQHRPTVIHED